MHSMIDKATELAYLRIRRQRSISLIICMEERTGCCFDIAEEYFSVLRSDRVALFLNGVFHIVMFRKDNRICIIAYQTRKVAMKRVLTMPKTSRQLEFLGRRMVLKIDSQFKYLHCRPRTDFILKKSDVVKAIQLQSGTRLLIY